MTKTRARPHSTVSVFKKELNNLKYEYHEERRAKEEADRQREEAIAFAQQTFNDNQRLRENLAAGENVLMEQAKGRASAEVAAAKKPIQDAFQHRRPRGHNRRPNAFD